jgi:hypothetical protein
VRKRAKELGFERPSSKLLALVARRLAYEEGLEVPPLVPAGDLPADAREAVRQVWEGFLLLVQCRWAVAPGVGVVFSRDHAAKWCQVTPDQARDAIEELRDLGLMDRSKLPKSKGGAWQWLPGDEERRWPDLLSTEHTDGEDEPEDDKDDFATQLRKSEEDNQGDAPF